MSKTILITGASSGIGKATAEYFVAKGWNVAATMRDPDRTDGLTPNKKLKLYRLDVLDDASIAAAISDAIRDFGSIDAIVNNAGYGAQGPMEAASKEQIERQFATNVTGLIAVIQSIVPYFREQGGGTIVNVSSIGGRITLPYYSLYHGTKWAVEGLTESLLFELAPFGIKVKIIEPGAIATDFGGRSLDVLEKDGLTAYDDSLAKFAAAREKFTDASAPAIAVAKVIYKATTDKSDRLRYLVGKDAKLFWRIRRIFGDATTIKIVRSKLNA